MEAELRCAILCQLSGITDFDDVRDFLLQADLYKNNGARFVCWLVAFRLIPSARVHWASHLRNLCVQYHNLIGKLYRNGSIDSLELVDPATARVIHADTIRTLAWFTRLSQEIGIPEACIADAEPRTRRMLSTIVLDPSPLVYTQGQDRYAWVSYLVALSFAIPGGLSRDFAEALAFNLARAFVSRCEVAKELDNFPAIERHFTLLDELIVREEPAVARLLARSSHSSLHYALKWQLTLFADEHHAHGLLYLWDQIIARESEMGDFVRCLCVGHVRQVPIPGDGDDMALMIQKHRSWDVAKIVDDAVALMLSGEAPGCLPRAAEKWLRFCFEYRRF
jgi:hypothetical protein